MNFFVCHFFHLLKSITIQVSSFGERDSSTVHLPLNLESLLFRDEDVDGFPLARSISLFVYISEIQICLYIRKVQGPSTFSTWSVYISVSLSSLLSFVLEILMEELEENPFFKV